MTFGSEYIFESYVSQFFFKVFILRIVFKNKQGSLSCTLGIQQWHREKIPILAELIWGKRERTMANK